MKKIITSVALLVAGFSASAYAQTETADFDSLLKKVEEGRVSESAQHKEREAEFLRLKAQQSSLLAAAQKKQAELERESARLEQNRRDNEAEITRQEEVKRERLGQLSELFGVLQQAAGDARSTIATSHVTLDHENRMAAIDTLVEKATDTSSLPTIAEIRAWPSQMMIEMVGSGEVKTFNYKVRLINGNTEEMPVTRIGDYAVVAEGKYLVLNNDGSLSELQRQPSSRFTKTVAPFQAATSGLHPLAIDPTRGQLLNLEIDKPTLEERVAQGGVIGYITLGLGVIGVALAIFQWVYLTFVSKRVKKQISNASTPNTNNPLGRILNVYANNKHVDVETLELKLDEAILKETPALERFLTAVKLVSAVAPLFGLLGTVTGMIETFQAITLFGAGDPTQMAGGISAALMTTVEGLVVAIPTLLLHAFVAGSSKSVIHVLEEQSAGIIAVQAEKEHANASA